MRHGAFTGAFYVGDPRMRWDPERAELALAFDGPTRQPVGPPGGRAGWREGTLCAASSLVADVLSLPVSGQAEGCRIATSLRHHRR